jgi:Phage Head-Tail Attachment
MSVESESDRLSFFEIEEFGVSATITSGSSTRTVAGIFDNSHFEIDNGYQVVSTTQPQLLCRTADVTDVEQGATVVISGVNWKAIDLMPDGTGMTLIKLHKA